MIVVSSEYKNYLKNNLSFSPKFKIEIEDKTYLGDEITAYPSIKHSNTSFIGGFPSKTCSFELYDPNTNIDLENKNITIYKGLDIDGVIEWVKQGVFIPKAEQITTDISKRRYKVTEAKDKRQLLDEQYISSLDWSTTHTGLEIIKDALNGLDIHLKTEIFNWSDYEFNEPNFPSNITRSEVISRMAEIGGAIAILNNEGLLEFKTQYATEDEITNKRYVNLTKEKTITINTLVLGKENANDDIVYPESIDEERIEYKINDNPYVDLIREEMIEQVSNYIIGLSYTPFSISDFKDGYIYELNDVLNVTDKNGNTFNAVILNYENSSRISSNISADKKDEQSTNYLLAGSQKKDLSDIKLNVDHINKKIEMIATQIENIEIGTGFATVETVNKLVQTATEGLVNTMSKKGGNNLLFNTYFNEKDENGLLTFWDGVQNVVNKYESKTGNALSLLNGSIKQLVQLSNGQYCLNFKYEKLIEVANCQVAINGRIFDLSNVDLNVENSFENVDNLSSDTFIIEFICDTDNGFLIYEPMLNEGPSASLFTQNANETVTDTVNIGKGIEVNASNINSKTRMDADGFRGFNTNNGEITFYQTNDGLYGKKLETESIKSGDLIISTKSNHNFFVGL